MEQLKWDERLGYVPVPREPKWVWEVFGDGDLKIEFMNNVSLYKRLITKLTLKSKWTKLR